MEIKVHDGGLCILTPFLSSFFDKLSIVDSKGFIKNNHSKKAIQLLNYLIDGHIDFTKSTNNLAYYFLGTPAIALSEDVCISSGEIEECHFLLKSIISYIPNLQQLSVENFQKQFLQREAILNTNENWIVVQRNAIDIVLDRLPWNFHLIKLPWLQNLLHVDW